MKLKIYSTEKPKFSLTAETYTIENGAKSESVWYSELETEDYDATKSMLEQSGYTAHPASSTEIETKEYTIFR